MPLNSKTIVLILLMQCLALTEAGSLSAQDTAAEFFEKKIRPALVEHCVRCHGEDKVQGGLRLDTREGWKAGGDSGHAIVAGDDESLLLQAIEYDDISLEMPPRGKLGCVSLNCRAIENFEQIQITSEPKIHRE